MLEEEVERLELDFEPEGCIRLVLEALVTFTTHGSCVFDDRLMSKIWSPPCIFVLNSTVLYPSAFSRARARSASMCPNRSIS